MLKLRKVAVTGGLSSGKSTVCRFLKECGAHVVSADEIVHQLLSPTTNLGQDVIKLLGAEIIVDCMIDRKRIAKKVFESPELLKKLEGLLHPAVQLEMQRQYRLVEEKGTEALFVAEIPLLFEANQDSWFDAVIAVMTDEKHCRERFVETTGYPIEEYERRMSLQLEPKEKAKRSHYILQNDGDLASLKKQTFQLFKILT